MGASAVDEGRDPKREEVFLNAVREQHGGVRAIEQRARFDRTHDMHGETEPGTT